MKRRIYSIGLIALLAGAILVWTTSHLPTPAIAGVAEAQADLDADHKEKQHADNHLEEADTKDEHGHDEHGDEGEFCEEHRVLEAQDAICNAANIVNLKPGDGMQVRLAALDAATKAGIRLAEPQQIALAPGIAIPGRAEFNRKRLASITPLAAGVVRQVHVQQGAQVAKGEVLAEVAMPEIVTLKGQLLTARARRIQTEAALQRERNLLERGISSRNEFQLAEAEFLSASSAAEQYLQQLQNFGLSTSDVEKLLRSGNSSIVVALSAPFAGTVTEVMTSLGEAVVPGAPLFTLVDLDTLWIELSIPESRVYQAELGATVQARFDGLPGTIFSGQIFQVGATIDERTRTLKVLAEVKNPAHRLKAGMFGQGRILSGSEEQLLAIPAGALQNIDGVSYVFIQRQNDLFELRRVDAGTEAAGLIPILAGLNPGEQVVASQGFALKSEVLQARLGASCTDE
jgi:membrane fusion protein, heavy metal efflux system